MLRYEIEIIRHLKILKIQIIQVPVLIFYN
jgi:hypothetical protein